MKQPRRRNGRYISKKEARAIQLFPLRLTIVATTIISVLCFAAYPDTVTWTRQVEARESMTDLCGLDTVVCDGEVSAKAQKAIDEIPHTSSTTEDWITYLYTEADKHNVDADKIAHAIYCESMWVCAQSNIVKNGKREPSYCIGQLHAPSHPDMSYDELNDPYHNIDYMIHNFEFDTWYGYDKKNDTCASGVPEYWN
jgi:hypothetical protein